MIRIQSEQNRKLIWPLAALLIIILFNILFIEEFLRIEIKDGHLFGSIIDILNRGAPILLLSIGMTIVFATGGIDLSVGSVMAMSGSIAARLIRPGYAEGILAYPDPPTSLFIVIAVPLLICMAAGLWNGFLVTFLRIQPIIATLILMVAGRGIAQLIVKGYTYIFIHEGFQFFGSGFLFGIPFPVILVIIVGLLTFLITRKTSLGMFIEAVGANPTASYYMGLRAKLIVLSTYIFSAFCAAVAGMIQCADIKCADANNAGLFMELDAIASVIIGGTIWGGRYMIIGSILGALIIQSITTTILTFNIPPEITLIFKALVIIIVALIQSEQLRTIFTSLFKRIRKEETQTT